jgi:hypothetical protein
MNRENDIVSFNNDDLLTTTAHNMLKMHTYSYTFIVEKVYG